MKKWLQSDIAIFLYKVLAIYIIWYLLYDLWLLPDGRLDRWLTHNIVAVCAYWLQLFHFNIYWMGRMIGIDGTPGVIMVNGCSGISVIGLFIGFVVAYPGRWIPRICYIFTGIGVIYLLNILRIITLVLTQKYWPTAFGFTHHYSSLAIFYLAIFAMWMIWVKWGDRSLPAPQAPHRSPAV